VGSSVIRYELSVIGSRGAEAAPTFGSRRGTRRQSAVATTYALWFGNALDNALHLLAVKA
jgi:hypothetical protein